MRSQVETCTSTKTIIINILYFIVRLCKLLLKSVQTKATTIQSISHWWCVPFSSQAHNYRIPYPQYSKDPSHLLSTKVPYHAVLTHRTSTTEGKQTKKSHNNKQQQQTNKTTHT